MYSYREFLELQKKSREHQDKKNEEMYLNTKREENTVKNEPDEDDYPYGIRFIKQ